MGGGARAAAAGARPARGRSCCRPQERLAALLGGRDAALACEELALRARGDLDHGRAREAALQLASRSTPRWPSSRRGASSGDMARRLDELDARRASASRRRARGGSGGRARRRARGGRRLDARGGSRRRSEARAASRVAYGRGRLASSASAATPPRARPRTSPSSRTDGVRRRYGVALLRHDRDPPAGRERDLGQPGHRIDLERGADAEHQVGAGGERRARASSPPRRASRRTARRRASAARRSRSAARRRGRLQPARASRPAGSARAAARHDAVRDRAVDLDHVARPRRRACRPSMFCVIDRASPALELDQRAVGAVGLLALAASRSAAP